MLFQYPSLKKFIDLSTAVSHNLFKQQAFTKSPASFFIAEFNTEFDIHDSKNCT